LKKNNLIEKDKAFHLLKLFIILADKKIIKIEAENDKMKKELSMWRRN